MMLSADNGVNALRSHAKKGALFGEGSPILCPVNTMGARVRHARELRGLSQNKLDKLAGTSQGMVSRLERDEREASSGTLQKIATALGVRADWLLSGTPPMDASTTAPDPVPHRAEAARLARDHGVFEEAIAHVCQEPVDALAMTRSVLWWADKMRLRQHQMVSNGDAQSPGATSSGVREVTREGAPGPALRAGGQK